MPCPSPQPTPELAGLLVEIARCPVVQDWYTQPERQAANSCHGIISYQVQAFGAAALASFQLPEPWRGDLAHAPLLFVSSNPSIDRADSGPYPHWHLPDEAIQRYYVDSFESEIVDGAFLPAAGGQRGRYVPFWGGIRKRAEELFKRSVQPGRDYALTEVVHCKSRSEAGVHGRRGALLPCTRRYLRRVLAASGARVVVILGAAARAAVAGELPELDASGAAPDWGTVWGPVVVGGRERLLVFMPHPNAHRPRTFKACVVGPDLDRLRAYLRRDAEATQVDQMETQEEDRR